MTYSHSIVTGVPGIVLIALGLQIKDPPWQVVGYVLLAVGVLLFVYSVAILLVCLAHETANILARLKEANAITSDKLLLDARRKLCDTVKGLDKDQTRIVLDNISILGISYAIMDREPYISGTTTPLWFFPEWLDKCTEEYLAPVGTWAEGTNKRDYAAQLTRLFVVKGLATEARDGTQWTGGNRPARWLNPVTYLQLTQFYTQNPPAPLD